MDLKTTYYKNILSTFDTHIMSAKSIKSGNHYTGQIKDFLLFLEQNNVLNLNKIDRDLMIQYFNLLTVRPKKRGVGKLSISSINDNLSTLRTFSIRMQSEKTLSKPIVIPNNIKKETEETDNNPYKLVREILSTKEIKTLFDRCDTLLEKALVSLAYGAGLRRGCLAELEESKIDFMTGMVTAFMDKNNKTRRVPVSDFFLKVLKDYSIYRLGILANLNKRNNSFFIDENGKTVSGEKLNQTLKSIIRRTEDEVMIGKNITLHCLRHSTATHLMDAGESYEFIREYLGHAVADTSLIYARRRQIKKYYQI